jgi:hypothetical protein
MTDFPPSYVAEMIAEIKLLKTTGREYDKKKAEEMLRRYPSLLSNDETKMS